MLHCADYSSKSVYLASCGAGLAPYPVHPPSRTGSDNHWVTPTPTHSLFFPPSFPCRSLPWAWHRSFSSLGVLLGCARAYTPWRLGARRTADGRRQAADGRRQEAASRRSTYVATRAGGRSSKDAYAVMCYHSGAGLIDRRLHCAKIYRHDPAGSHVIHMYVCKRIIVVAPRSAILCPPFLQLSLRRGVTHQVSPRLELPALRRCRPPLLAGADG